MNALMYNFHKGIFLFALKAICQALDVSLDQVHMMSKETDGLTFSYMSEHYITELL